MDIDPRNLPFPNEADRIYEQSREFMRLSPEDRITAVFDVIVGGTKIIAASPRREAAAQRKIEYERQWQRIQMELFANYGL